MFGDAAALRPYTKAELAHGIATRCVCAGDEANCVTARVWRVLFAVVPCIVVLVCFEFEIFIFLFHTGYHNLNK